MVIHHLTLKAAITKYSPLVTEAKTEEEIKAEIAKDEKQFTPEAIDEIYAALIAAPTEEEKPAAYIVIQEFRDVNDFSLRYDIGDDVSSFNSDRLAVLEGLGLVEKQ